jgi:dTMP kinase
MFITLEGPEGSGKTSQLAQFAEFLQEQGYEVVTTREPGGTSIGNQIRQVLVSMENKNLHPRTEILLFLSARAQLVEELIKPSLADGKIVVCDRYGDSTLAYQGYGHGLPLAALREMLRFATDGLVPDLTLYLDIEVEKGLLRKKKGQEWNRLDAYEVEFHRRVRNGYLALAAEEPQRWCVIDASQPKQAVQQAMRAATLAALDKLKNKAVSQD